MKLLELKGESWRGCRKKLDDVSNSMITGYVITDFFYYIILFNGIFPSKTHVQPSYVSNQSATSE